MDVLRSRWYDLVFIHLEAFPIGPPVIEWLISFSNVPIVFDLDDAVFLPRRSMASPVVQMLRMPQKVSTILRWSKGVITCNDYLKSYVEQFNSRVCVIPTCVDVHQFQISASRSIRDRPLIGWVGSPSTSPYLEALKPVLSRLSKKYKFTFKIVGAARPFQISNVDIIQEPWSLEKDVSYFQELDIGVYPLPSEPWVLGKTGFKTVQYMSVGVPCVASDVGRNREIVEDGVNGFLARTEEEWVEKLGGLISNPKLRERFGRAGRQTVEAHYSLDAHMPRLLSVLRQAAEINQDVG